MPEQDTDLGGEMVKEYQDEVEKLESAVKNLLFIIAEHMPADLRDQSGKPVDIGKQLRSVRKTLQQTRTFKSNWDR